MSTTVVSIFVALQVLYFLVAVGQITLVASKFYPNLVKKLELRRTRSGFTVAVGDSVQDKFAVFSGGALLLCCVLTAVRALLFILGDTRVISCALMAHFGSSMFQIFKGLMYLVFIFRAEAIYRNTVYAYSTRRMAATATFVALLNVVIFVLFNVYITGFEKHDAGALCVCGAKVPMKVLFVSILQDIGLSFLFLYLFTRPLQRLRKKVSERGSSQASPRLPSLEFRPSDDNGSSKLSSEKESDTENHVVVRESTPSRRVELGRRGSDDEFLDLQRVAVKCAVVTWVAVASTLLNLLLIGTADFLELIVLDWLINNTCMIFMTSWCDQYFPKLCCLPLSVARIVPSGLCCGDIPDFAPAKIQG